MEAATDDIPAKAKKRRTPMEGVELLAFAAKMVLNGADYIDIARRCGIPQPQAMKLHAELCRQAWDQIKDAYGADYIKARHMMLVKKHEHTVKQCDKAVDLSFKNGDPNTRAYTHKNAAMKQLALLEGHNAPTQTVNTDIRVYAAVQPKDMDRVLSNPRARAAMLEFEEVVSEINAADPGPAIIDVTPAEPAEGADA